MKKRIFWLLALAVLIFCPVTSHAAETEEVTYVVNGKNVSNLVEMKDPNGVSISTAHASASINHSMAASKKQVNKLHSVLKDFKSSANLSKYRFTKSDMQSALNTVLKDDYYLLDSIISVNVSARFKNGYITTAYFKYYYSKSTMKKRYSSLVSAVKAAKKSIGTVSSKEQAALAVHDYLIKRATYDMDYYNYAMAHKGYVNWNAHSARGILVSKKGVCSGYAYAYRILMKEYGIPCIIVDSTAMNHAWNMIKLGGQWYHVDCTWDDPDASTSWKENGSGNLVYYTHFLLNNTEMNQAKHHSWTPNYVSYSTTYSRMPRYTSNQQIGYKGNWYVVYKSGYSPNYTYIYTRINFKGTSQAPLVYSTSQLVSYKNRIFYVENGTALRSMNIDGSENRDLTSRTTLPAGTTYQLAGMSGNRLVFTINGQNQYWGLPLSAYDVRTTDKATSLKLSTYSKTLKKKKSFYLKSAVGPSWAIDKTVYYKSNNPKVASVGKTSGKVIARKKGKATITAYVRGTNLRATCKVTVK